MSGITGSCSPLRTSLATSAEFSKVQIALLKWKQQAEDYMIEHKGESESDLLQKAKAVASVASCINNVIDRIQEDFLLDSVEQIVLCRAEDGCLEGVMNTSLNIADILSLDYLCVNPKNMGLTPLALAYREKGVGTALVQHAKDFCLERDCKKIWCMSRKETEGFYKKMGFEEDELYMEISAEAIRKESRVVA